MSNSAQGRSFDRQADFSIPFRAHDSICSWRYASVHWHRKTQTQYRHNSWMEHRMPRRNKRTPEVENVRAYVEGVAKNLCDKLYGPQGPAWGTKLTEIEDVCLDI